MSVKCTIWEREMDSGIVQKPGRAGRLKNFLQCASQFLSIKKRFYDQEDYSSVWLRDPRSRLGHYIELPRKSRAIFIQALYAAEMTITILPDYAEYATEVHLF